MAEKTEAEKVRDITRANEPIFGVNDVDRQIAIVPDGYHIHDLEEYLEKPVRQRDNRVFHDIESFVMYCSDFKGGFQDGEARLFADRNKTAFFAIFDYNGWKDHTAKYTCPLSDEWKRWEPNSGKPKTQHEFAQFIEDNLPDIYKPEGAEMLEISRSLEAKKNVNFLSTTRLRDGTVDFTFEEKVETTASKGKIVVPEVFEIFIPVFMGGESIFINAKLRYRIGDGGKLAIWYELERPHKILDKAFKGVRESIETALEVKALMGEI